MKTFFLILFGVILFGVAGCNSPSITDKALIEALTVSEKVPEDAIQIVHLADSLDYRIVVVDKKDAYFVQVNRQTANSEFVIYHKQKLDLTPPRKVTVQ
jgi:hypothetical protein